MTNHSSLEKAAEHIFAMANRRDLNPYERQTFLNCCFDLTLAFIRRDRSAQTVFSENYYSALNNLSDALLTTSFSSGAKDWRHLPKYPLLEQMVTTSGFDEIDFGLWLKGNLKVAIRDIVSNKLVAPIATRVLARGFIRSAASEWISEQLERVNQRYNKVPVSYSQMIEQRLEQIHPYISPKTELITSVISAIALALSVYFASYPLSAVIAVWWISSTIKTSLNAYSHPKQRRDFEDLISQFAELFDTSMSDDCDIWAMARAMRRIEANGYVWKNSEIQLVESLAALTQEAWLIPDELSFCNFEELEGDGDMLSEFTSLSSRLIETK